MGKSHKANYNKKKEEKVVAFVDQDESTDVIYSIDRAGLWEIVPAKAEITNEERRDQKTKRKDENRAQKKDEFRHSLWCERHNLQKLKNGDPIDHYDSIKKWFKNPRINMPDKLRRQIEDEKNPPVHYDEENQDVLIEEKTRTVSDEEDHSDEQDFENFKFITTKEHAKVEKPQKKEKKPKGNKSKRDIQEIIEF